MHIIFHNSNRNYIRPVKNQSEATHIHMGFQLMELVEVDDVKQHMAAQALVTVEW